MGLRLAGERDAVVEVGDLSGACPAGAEPMEALFAKVAKPHGTAKTAGVWLAGKRLVAVGGTCRDLQDTPLNAAFFGRARVSPGESVLPADAGGCPG